MSHEAYFVLGRIIKPHSYKGAVKLKVTHERAHEIELKESVFIEINDQPVPFFIDQFEHQNKDFYIIKFEGVDTEEQARNICGARVILPKEMEPVSEGKEFYRDELNGYSVIDANEGDIGVLKEVISNPGNDVFSIEYNDKEILIPAIEDFIVQIDRENKVLHLRAPEGLIRFYLDEL